ncbi:Imm8 family immunity protein, partial [Neisseria meningitidis]|uniref:Imm8 family immunity protein n=1 Tax=Neisseria meningitidis TaxID=487 RepID=UPI001BABA70D
MINLELKAINLYDCAFEDFVPEIKDNFCVGIDLDIGTDDSDAADIFSVRICSPKWILHNFFQNQRVKWGAELLRMNGVHYGESKSEIEKIFKKESKYKLEK